MTENQKTQNKEEENIIYNGKQENKLDMDQCLEFVNPQGRYQRILFFILLAQGIFGSFIFVGGPYYFEDPIFLCQNGMKCKQEQACSEGSFMISPESNQTLSLQFQLYCDRQYLKNLSLSFVFIGSFFGQFFFSFLSDLKGRRSPMILSWVFGVLGTAILAYSDNIAMVLAGQFLSGFGIYPATTLAFIILSEQSLGQFRKVKTGYLLLGYTLSQGVINLIGYVFDNNWIVLIRYWFLIPMILLLFTNFYIIESPRFYLNKDTSKLVDCLNEIQTRNQIDQANQTQNLSKDQIDFNKYQLTNKQQVYSYLTLFQYKSTRSVTVLCSFQRFLMVFFNYGTQFSVSYFGFNIFINATIGFCAELLSFVFLANVLNTHKRKPSLLLFQLLSSLFSFLFIVFPITESCKESSCYQKFIQILLYFLSRISITSYFVVVGSYFPELYPTPVRSLGVGFIRGVGISGSILSSFIITLSRSLGISPLVSFGIIGSFALAPTYFLPETLNKPLNDEIDEIRNKNDQQNDENNQIELNLLNKTRID